MNNREAIALLRNLEDALDSYCELNEEGKNAFRMAIESLEHLPSAQPEIKTDGDTISRQAAIDALAEHEKSNGHNYTLFVDIVSECAEIIRDLPSAQPERKGRWIKLDMHAHLAGHKCTACGQECYVPTCMGEPMYTYCPNCGADMRGEQE